MIYLAIIDFVLITFEGEGGFNFHVIWMAGESITCRLISIHYINRLELKCGQFVHPADTKYLNARFAN